IVTRGAGLVSGQGQAGSGNTTLDAGRDVQVLSAQDHHVESHYRQEKKSGVSASLGGGISVGRSSVTQSQSLHSTTQAGSSVSGQDVGMVAQRDAAIQSSQILADRDITVQAGRNLDISAADNTQETTSRFESRSTQAGLIGGISLNQTLLSDQAAKQNAQETVVSQSTSVLSANAGSTDNERLANAQRLKAAHGAYKLSQSMPADPRPRPPLAARRPPGS
ncbi:MAG: hemagglutinin repeat-containing protein, partial [Pseudomonadota bacterium]